MTINKIVIGLIKNHINQKPSNEVNNITL